MELVKRLLNVIIPETVEEGRELLICTIFRKLFYYYFN